jgi:hypothetical protein
MYAQRNPRWEDFDYTYLDEMGGNPMTWLGNGYTGADYDGSSRTMYLDPKFIDYPPLPKSKPVTNGVNLTHQGGDDDRVKAGAVAEVVALPLTTAA